MNCQDFELDIDDYVDARLDPQRRARLEEHLRTCAVCRALTADLRTLSAAIDTLEPQQPSPHVWTRIAAAVEIEPRSSPFLNRFGWATNWRMAMSATAVVGILVGGASLAFREARSSSQPRPRAARAATPLSPLQPPAAVFDAATSDYASAITSLEQITDTDVDTLGTPTAVVVRDNLAVLDTAIQESRRALDTDPSSDIARDSLLDALRSKIDLLQDTVALINDVRSDDGESRRGNPENAAPNGSAQ